MNPGTDIIILDDAYQHRYIEPGLSILLIDYNRLITSDYLLPAGRLREHRSSVKRADIVLITKSPPGISAIDMRLIYKKLPLRPEQHLFFTGLSYEEPAYIFNDQKQAPDMKRISEELNNVLLITGIAEPGPLLQYLSAYKLDITHLKYPDHHLYRLQDYKNITDTYLSLPEGRRCIITTEKDAIRLREGICEKDFPDERLFYLRINVEFLNNDADEFNKFILNYVRKNKRNNSLS
ncbi:MAG: tetraacyldisaccharide 4'-kinase [Bacteroidales bacterium]|nr:tetraacyldisaccharide 4'-kinase [Bacteroidales bacterium]